MRYLVRFLLLILAVVCIIGARRVSRAQASQPKPADTTTQVAQARYLP